MVAQLALTLTSDEVAMKPSRFDVHAHYMPPGAIPRAVPGLNFVSSPMPTWTPEFALDFMDRHDIATQLLSLPTPLAKSEARRINEYGATLVKQRPERFGLLASLPIDDVEAAVSEIAFAFDQLGADGVVMVTNYGGNYFGKRKVRAGIRRTKPTVGDGFPPSDNTGRLRMRGLRSSRTGDRIYLRHMPHGGRHSLRWNPEPVQQCQVHSESCGRAFANIGAAAQHNRNAELGSSSS
jgi:hypothetical protein